MERLLGWLRAPVKSRQIRTYSRTVVVRRKWPKPPLFISHACDLAAPNCGMHPVLINDGREGIHGGAIYTVGL